MPKFESINPHKFVILANTHINWFNGMIESGSRQVNVGECQHYIHVWENVLAVAGDWNKMTADAQREIRDAAYSREYDEILGLSDDDFE